MVGNLRYALFLQSLRYPDKLTDFAMAIDAVKVRHKVALQGLCPLPGFSENLAEFGLRNAFPHCPAGIHIRNAQQNSPRFHIQGKFPQTSRMAQHNPVKIIVKLAALIEAHLIHLQ